MSDNLSCGTRLIINRMGQRATAEMRHKSFRLFQLKNEIKPQLIDERHLVFQPTAIRRVIKNNK